jgi:hypothetical protein
VGEGEGLEEVGHGEGEDDTGETLGIELCGNFVGREEGPNVGECEGNLEGFDDNGFKLGLLEGENDGFSPFNPIITKLENEGRFWNPPLELK